MSLTDVNTISAIQFDVTPSGGGATSRNYIAKNVRVQRWWRGETWMLSDGTQQINTEFRHLIFTITGSDIDQVSNTGNLRDPILLSEDLLDPDGYTVELYPDADQTKKFEVIAFQPNRMTLAEFEYMGRVDQDSLQCITVNSVSRSDVEWFRKFG